MCLIKLMSSTGYCCIVNTKWALTRSTECEQVCRCLDYYLKWAWTSYTQSGHGPFPHRVGHFIQSYRGGLGLIHEIGQWTRSTQIGPIEQ